MKWYYKVGIGLISATLIYLLGNLIPIRFLQPKIEFSTIQTADYYSIVVNSISAFVTFLAVIIALFKEDIRKLWEFSKITVTIPSESFFEVLNSSIGNTEDNISRPLEAIKYYCNIEVCNSGNISAMGLEIQLESLTFSSPDFTTPQMIETSSKSISWNNQNESKINLSPEGRKIISIIELSAPEQQSSPGGNNTTLPSKLNFAGISNNSDFIRGKWVGSFAIFSTNAKPTRFKIEIDWNGRWQSRATEMRSNLRIDLKQ